MMVMKVTKETCNDSIPLKQSITSNMYILPVIPETMCSIWWGWVAREGRRVVLLIDSTWVDLSSLELTHIEVFK